MCTLSVRLTVVGACAVVLAGCASASTTRAGVPSSGIVSTQTPTPTTAGAAQEVGRLGENRALAAKAGARALDQFPVPPGSTRLAAASRRAAGLHLGAYIGPVDPNLTRARWWRVPLRYDQLVRWYATHTPADARSTFPPDSTTPVPAGDFFWSTQGTSSAYSVPVDVVDYVKAGANSTAIRTSVTLAARADRVAQTLVPSTVTSITVTKRAIDGPNTHPRTVTVDNQVRIRAVVSGFNDLQGNYASVQPEGCGSPAGIVYVYAVTFYWAGHSLVVDAGAALCGVGRGLTLDGKKLAQTLENDSSFDTALAAAFRG